jgi:hypothetical protein
MLINICQIGRMKNLGRVRNIGNGGELIRVYLRQPHDRHIQGAPKRGSSCYLTLIISRKQPDERNPSLAVHRKLN